MAYFGFGGGATPRATRTAGNSARRERAHVSVGTYASSSTRAGTKAPHVPSNTDYAPLAAAGTGQRFPFVTRVVSIST